MNDRHESPYRTPQPPAVARRSGARRPGALVLMLLVVIGISTAIAIGNYRYRQALRAQAAAVQARRTAQAQQQLQAERSTQEPLESPDSAMEQ